VGIFFLHEGIFGWEVELGIAWVRMLNVEEMVPGVQVAFGMCCGPRLGGFRTPADGGLRVGWCRMSFLVDVGVGRWTYWSFVSGEFPSYRCVCSIVETAAYSPADSVALEECTD
jgi:hypothetical protein